MDGIIYIIYHRYMALKLPFTQNCTGYQGNISNGFYFQNNTKLLQSATVSLAHGN